MCKKNCQNRRELGVAALGVVIVLLMAASLIVFFANRSFVFEQRASANQMRSARALATAESGLEWAIARLNDPRRIDTQCVAAGAALLSFRERFAPATGEEGFAPMDAARPGCMLRADSLACMCPQAGAAPGLVGNDASFTIELSPVPGDAEALRITSRGCTSAARDCVPGSAEGAADAVAVVQSIVKLVPPWLSMPVAAVTSNASIDIAPGVELANTDAATQGLIADAAGQITGADATGGQFATVAGSPLESAMLGRDEALAARPADDPDALFMRRFGMSIGQFRANPAVRVISDCSAADCEAQLSAASAEGVSAFFVDGDLQLGTPGQGASIGSETRPLLAVVRGRVTAGGAAPWHGLIHATGPTIASGITLRGALVSQGDLSLATGTHITYENRVLRRLRRQLGVFAKVPGSWRDGRCAIDDASQPCTFAP